jgi:hypothetical protein
MTENELIDKIKKTNLGDCEISINFSYKENGAYVAEIKDVIVECTDLHLFINIGKIDDMLNENIKL